MGFMLIPVLMPLAVGAVLAGVDLRTARTTIVAGGTGDFLAGKVEERVVVLGDM
jgi:hypothetical protein